MKAKILNLFYFSVFSVCLLSSLLGCGRENLGTVEEIMEGYKTFIHSQSDALDYLIYDIDEDGYPELFFGKHIEEERADIYEIYTYKNGDFNYVGSEYGPGGHICPILASYPHGNGVLRYSGGYKGKELIYLCKLVEGNYRDAETVFLSNQSMAYYRDSGDVEYQKSYNREAFINHQYYLSENSSPYYEGSYLLAQSEMTDFTAVYEAFGYSDNEIPTLNENMESEIVNEVDLELLQSYIGKTKSDIPYDIKEKMWGDKKCYETTEKVRMMDNEGSLIFELMDNSIIGVCWNSDTIPYEEIEQIIKSIRESTDSEQLELYEDELLWVDVSNGVEYYADFHEVPFCVGVQQILD